MDKSQVYKIFLERYGESLEFQGLNEDDFLRKYIENYATDLEKQKYNLNNIYQNLPRTELVDPGVQANVSTSFGYSFPTKEQALKPFEITAKTLLTKLSPLTPVDPMERKFFEPEQTIDYSKKTRDTFPRLLVESVANDNKIIEESVLNKINSNPKYKAHFLYRKQNPLSYPSSLADLAEYAGMVVPEVGSQIVAYGLGGPALGTAYNATRIFGGEMAEDIQEGLDRGEDPENIFNTAILSASLSTTAQTVLEAAGMPKALKTRLGASRANNVLNKINNKLGKSIYSKLRINIGDSAKLAAGKKFTTGALLAAGPALREALTEVSQGVIDEAIDMYLGYGDAEDFKQTLPFGGDEFAQNLIGGLMGGGIFGAAGIARKTRDLYKAAEKTEALNNEVYIENSLPIGEQEQSVKSNADKQFVQEKQNEREAAKKLNINIQINNLLPTIKTTEDYFKHTSQIVEGGGIFNINEIKDGKIKEDTDQDTKDLVVLNSQKKLNPNQKLLAAYQALKKKGLNDKAIFDLVDDEDKKDFVKDVISGQIQEKGFGDISNKTKEKLKQDTRDSLELQGNPLSSEETLNLVNAKNPAERFNIIKKAYTRGYEDQLDDKELKKIISLAHQEYEQKNKDQEQTGEKDLIRKEASEEINKNKATTKTISGIISNMIMSKNPEEVVNNLKSNYGMYKNRPEILEQAFNNLNNKQGQLALTRLVKSNKNLLKNVELDSKGKFKSTPANMQALAKFMSKGEPTKQNITSLNLKGDAVKKRGETKSYDEDNIVEQAQADEYKKRLAAIQAQGAQAINVTGTDDSNSTANKVRKYYNKNASLKKTIDKTSPTIEQETVDALQQDINNTEIDC